MNNISKPIIFFGTEDFSAVSLMSLIEAGYNIAAVITKPDSKKGRGHKVTPSTVKVIANKYRIPVWQPEKLSEVSDDIRALGDVAGVLVSFGKIIPQSIIDLFTPGIINVHPSLLPLYRGPSPIESAIKNGDEVTGVSIMQLSKNMDAGPVYAQSTHTLTGTETQPELYQTLARVGADLLLSSLPAILNGSLQPHVQDEASISYCNLLGKTDSFIHVADMNAGQVERQVRAHLAFPKTKLTVLGHDIIILKAHVALQSKTPFDVLCRDGVYISIDELIAPSGRKMDAASFIRGYAGGV